MRISRSASNLLAAMLIFVGLQVFDLASATETNLDPVAIDYAQTYGVSVEEAQWRLH